MVSVRLADLLRVIPIRGVPRTTYTVTQIRKVHRKGALTQWIALAA